MPILKETALDILGLPTFATPNEIMLRYKSLALTWFPEGHCNPDLAKEIFGHITEAAVRLICAEKKSFRKLTLEHMYSFFQYVFLQSKVEEEEDFSDDYSEDSSIPFEVAESVLDAKEMKAEDNASELINEEERDKLKAEKRKAKKKRRKERKKQEKQTTDQPSAQNASKSASKDSKQKNHNTKSSDSEEEIDISSEFVKVVARKQKHLLQAESTATNEPRKKPPEIDNSSDFVTVIPKKQKKLLQAESKAKNEPAKIPSVNTPKDATSNKNAIVNTPSTFNEVRKEPVELQTSLSSNDHQAALLRSRELALRGNELASSGHFKEAVELFSESIRLDPSDHRFYGNRSYCFDRLGDFERALKDAEKSIVLSPVWPKGYFRKGRALLGLRKYALAEQFFIEVLKRDEDCDDAICELRKARVLQLMEKGYSQQMAETALAQHGTVQEALNSLYPLSLLPSHIRDDLDIFISDDESNAVLKPVPTKQPEIQIAEAQKEDVQKLPRIVIKDPQPQQPYDIKMDPNNPEGHTSLWIGNVQPNVTEKKLLNMFSRFGELISVKVMPEKFCGFINYKNKASPGQAMKAYQGFELSGYNLLIRFPHLPGEVVPKKKPVIVSAKETKVLEPVNGNECYFWRTSGCVNGSSCRYQHVKEHKGIDLKKKKKKPHKGPYIQRLHKARPF